VIVKSLASARRTPALELGGRTAASYSGGMSAAVLRLKVTLGGMAPKALRRIEVPADIKLNRGQCDN
jgi:hypothetical protein